MNIKILITSVGVSALLLGIGMNVHRAWNDHGIKEASLSQFVIGQGTSSSTSCLCSERGGTELPKKILMPEKYVKSEIKWMSSEISSGLESGGSIIYGRRCVCKDPPSSYMEELGCNLSWERVCD